MPAFKLPTEGGDGEEIIFEDSLKSVDAEIGGAVHAPEFDAYEALGYVPSKAFIENGWYLYCDECDRRSDCEDDEDHDDQSIEHIFRGRFYFCHPECERVWDGRHHAEKKDQEELRSYLVSRYPGLQVKAMVGGGEYSLYGSVEFPGGKGSISKNLRSNTLDIHTRNADEWNLFVEGLKDAV